MARWGTAALLALVVAAPAQAEPGVWGTPAPIPGASGSGARPRAGPAVRRRRPRAGAVEAGLRLLRRQPHGRRRRDVGAEREHAARLRGPRGRARRRGQPRLRLPRRQLPADPAHDARRRPGRHDLQGRRDRPGHLLARGQPRGRRAGRLHGRQRRGRRRALLGPRRRRAERAADVHRGRGHGDAARSRRSTPAAARRSRSSGDARCSRSRRPTRRRPRRSARRSRSPAARNDVGGMRGAQNAAGQAAIEWYEFTPIPPNSAGVTTRIDLHAATRGRRAAVPRAGGRAERQRARGRLQRQQRHRGRG